MQSTNSKDSSPKRKARRLEEALAIDLGGRRVPGSGAFDDFKGDVELENWLIEAKLTEKQSFRIDVSSLQKITREAFDEQKAPALVIRFGGDQRLDDGNTFVVVPYEAFKAIAGKPSKSKK